MKTLIRSWQHGKSCTKRELLSLIGQLQHACKVIPSGRSFLRRMISSSTTAKELHHHICLNTGFRSDLQWWSMFLTDWNGRQMLACMSRTNIFATIFLTHQKILVVELGVAPYGFRSNGLRYVIGSYHGERAPTSCGS